MLDTTGSMQRELNEAKARVVDLARSIGRTRPGETLRFGVVAYRDRGDDYVTKVQPLAEDVAEPLAFLEGLQAGGGGDSPEDVLGGVAAGIKETGWRDGAERMLFLVGDAPPHLDYADGPTPDELVTEALRQGIAIHTIGCRSLPAAGIRFFRRLAYATEGSYQHIGAVRATKPELADALLRAAAPTTEERPSGEPIAVEPRSRREGGAGTALRVRHGGSSGSAQGGEQALDGCMLEIRVPPGMALRASPNVMLSADALEVGLTVAGDSASVGSIDWFTMERCAPLATPVRVTLGEG
ncbi:MAG: vWA domain-containing protein [Acidobacteriota bacterium]